MLTVANSILVVFYAGAVLATGWSWLGVRRGFVGYSALRDLTGIGDRVTLRRLFGLTRPDGAYNVTLANILRHRRPAGVALTDLPVHALFLAALAGVALTGADAAPAIICAAAAHAAVVGCAGVSILLRGLRTQLG